MGKRSTKLVLFFILLIPGLAVPQMKWENLMLLKAAAEKGNSEAQFLFGIQVLAGDGIERDRAEAEKWIRKAADAGHVEAQQVLAKSFAISGAQEAALTPSQSPAKSDMVDEDPAETIRWSLLLSGLRGADAYLVRGFMLENSIVVNRDFVAAAASYRKAAGQGDARAQYRLGLMFAEGRGVAKDPVASFAWLTRAAANGSAEAADELARLKAILPAVQKADSQLPQVSADQAKKP